MDDNDEGDEDEEDYSSGDYHPGDPGARRGGSEQEDSSEALGDADMYNLFKSCGTIWRKHFFGASFTRAVLHVHLYGFSSITTIM